MSLIINFFVVLIGISFATASLYGITVIFPYLVINLGLEGTIISLLCALLLTIPWLYKKSSQGWRQGPSVRSLLAQSIAIGFAAGAAVEFILIFFSGPNPEMMTWANKVVIYNGQVTLDGWIVTLRGCLESAFVTFLFCVTVAIIAKLMNYFCGVDDI